MLKTTTAKVVLGVVVVVVAQDLILTIAWLRRMLRFIYIIVFGYHENLRATKLYIACASPNKKTKG